MPTGAILTPPKAGPDAAIPPIITDPRTKTWWRHIWRSPMASQWIEVDRYGLLLVATLIDAFYRIPTPALAAEIRQQEARFGLDPVSRRRLGWEIEPEPKKHGPEEPDDEPDGDYLAALRQVDLRKALRPVQGDNSA